MLACGMPILLADIPWDDREIEKNKCGKIISENKNDIISKIAELMDENKNQEYRNNVIRYSENFDYKNIFKKLIL